MWCARCRYGGETTKFYQNRCPQCQTILANEDILKSYPFKERIKHKESKPKKFLFDQTANDVKSIPTETLEFFKL